MIAVDTHILARFYCDDPDDAEAKRQRPRAWWVMLEFPAIFVPLTVVAYSGETGRSIRRKSATRSGLIGRGSARSEAG